MTKGYGLLGFGLGVVIGLSTTSLAESLFDFNMEYSNYMINSMIAATPLTIAGATYGYIQDRKIRNKKLEELDERFNYIPPNQSILG